MSVRAESRTDEVILERFSIPLEPTKFDLYSLTNLKFELASPVLTLIK